jgi:phosphomannomutase/phosphoglucomutase
VTAINPSIFREYDIRGLVGEDLTQKTVYALGRAYAAFLSERGITQAIVGRDNRLSSYAYSQAVVDALLASGIHVLDIGMVTTPVFYFARVKRGIEGGVMVTGSHNPPDFNGFKLAYGPDTLYGDGIQEIRHIAEKGDFADGSGRLSFEDLVPAYALEIAERISLGPKRVRAVVDAGNGAGGPTVREVLGRIGASFEEMYFEPDGTFPHHHPDPTQKKNTGDLSRRVVETGADLGIAFDGDADRIGVVDRTGRPVWGDELQIVFWREILEKHPGALALVEVKCSQSLVDEVLRLGGRPEFTRTGHSLIKARMREAGALFAGEMSGHMFFRDEYYGFDDAVYAAGRLLRLLSNSEKGLAELLEDVPQYFSTPEVRVDCPDEEKFKVVGEVSGTLSRTNQVIAVDGARVLFPGGWGLLRASNTQPALVLRAEARTPAELAGIKQVFEKALGGFPSVGAIQWDQ